MDGDAKQANLVRDGAVVGVKADPRNSGRNPPGLQSPGAGSGTAIRDLLESITFHENLVATQRIRATSRWSITERLSSRPHDPEIGASVADLDSHQEPHSVQPAHQWRRSTRLGVRPEGLAVVHAVQHMFDVAVRR